MYALARTREGIPVPWQNDKGRRYGPWSSGNAISLSGDCVRDLIKAQPEACWRVEEVHGAADAKAAEIYAGAYKLGPEAAAIYEFKTTVQSDKSIIEEITVLVRSTGGNLLEFLKVVTLDTHVVPGLSPGNSW